MSEKQEQQNTERSRMLGTMEMRKLVPTVSVPIMVSMLVQALYNIVDGIFVGQYSPDALTAVNLAMPMQMLMIAVSTGMGTGINSLISRRLGEKRSHEARGCRLAAVRHRGAVLRPHVYWHDEPEGGSAGNGHTVPAHRLHAQLGAVHVHLL